MTIKTLADPRKALAIWSALLGALSYQVAKGHLAVLDQPLAHWLSTWRSPALDAAMHLASVFGGSAWMVVGLLGLGWWAWRRGGTTLVLVFLGAYAVGSMLELSLKLSALQWRPDVVTIPASLDMLTRFRLAGFPSGHGFRSAFMFGWVARQWDAAHVRWAPAGGLACGVMIMAVGVSRLYLNRHWASDVLGGWLVALVALSLARCWGATHVPKSTTSP